MFAGGDPQSAQRPCRAAEMEEPERLRQSMGRHRPAAASARLRWERPCTRHAARLGFRGAAGRPHPGFA